MLKGNFGLQLDNEEKDLNCKVSTTVSKFGHFDARKNLFIFRKTRLRSVDGMKEQ